MNRDRTKKYPYFQHIRVSKETGQQLEELKNARPEISKSDLIREALEYYLPKQLQKLKQQQQL